MFSSFAPAAQAQISPILTGWLEEDSCPAFREKAECHITYMSGLCGHRLIGVQALKWFWRLLPKWENVLLHFCANVTPEGQLRPKSTSSLPPKCPPNCLLGALNSSWGDLRAKMKLISILLPWVALHGYLNRAVDIVAVFLHKCFAVSCLENAYFVTFVVFITLCCLLSANPNLSLDWFQNISPKDCCWELLLFFY